MKAFHRLGKIPQSLVFSFILSSFIAGNLALASGNPSIYQNYLDSLATSCPSFGPQTQRALGMISTTQDLLGQLGEKCGGARDLKTSISKLQDQLSYQFMKSGTNAHLLEEQAEIESLSRLAASIPDGTGAGASSTSANAALQTIVITTLAQKRSQYAIDVAAAASSSGYLDHIQQLNQLPLIATQLNSIEQHLKTLQTCTDPLPPELLANIAGSLLPMAASVVNPALGVAATAGGNLISTLANFISNERYAKYIRKLDRIVQEQAIGCALEQIQFARCDAIDNIKIIEWKNAKRMAARDHTAPKRKTSWDGYNLLVTHMPLVSRWIQKVQTILISRGEDATYFEDSVNISAKYQIAKVAVQSAISEAQDQILNGAQDYTQGKDLLKIILDKTDAGTGSGRSSFFGGGSSSPKINIFLSVKSAEDLPFYLINRRAEDLNIPNSGLSGPYLINDPRNTKKLPTDLVGTIASQMNALLLATDTELARVERQRRGDAGTLILNAVGLDNAKRSPMIVFKALSLWLQNFVDRENRKDLEALYRNTPNPNASIDNLIDQATKLLEKVNLSVQALENPLLDDKAKISQIATALEISKNGDRLLVERFGALVKTQLMVNKKKSPADIAAIFNGSREEMYQKLVGTGSLSPEASVYAQLQNARDAHAKHLNVLADFFRKPLTTELRNVVSEDERGQICLRLLSLPNLPNESQLIGLCSGTEIKSEFYQMAEPEWKSRLKISFDDFAGLDGRYGAAVSFEDRQCSYRDFRRNSYIYRLEGLQRLQSESSDDTSQEDDEE
ncbi:MAG: hypothetical protein H7222_08085 [Methylotenera sp.]|nr:hypothetical protein [Oligoflexia bacterium]